MYVSALSAGVVHSTTNDKFVKSWKMKVGRGPSGRSG
jgi:hypothetical protein